MNESADDKAIKMQKEPKMNTDMNIQYAQAMAAVKDARDFPGEPALLAMTTYVIMNPDGTLSVCDNGEEVVCHSDTDAARIAFENMRAGNDTSL